MPPCAAEPLRKARLHGAPVQRRALDAARLWHAHLHGRGGRDTCGRLQPAGGYCSQWHPRCHRPAGAKERREVLALARLHPKKGLDRLVDAWAQVEREETSRGWWLTLARPRRGGPPGHASPHRRRGVAWSACASPAPLYGAEKADRLARAAVFALPLPQREFRNGRGRGAGGRHTRDREAGGTPWSGLEAERCGWWVPGTRDALAWGAPGGACAAARGQGSDGRARPPLDGARFRLAHAGRSTCGGLRVGPRRSAGHATARSARSRGRRAHGLRGAPGKGPGVCRSTAARRSRPRPPSGGGPAFRLRLAAAVQLETSAVRAAPGGGGRAAGLRRAPRCGARMCAGRRGSSIAAHCWSWGRAHLSTEAVECLNVSTVRLDAGALVFGRGAVLCTASHAGGRTGLSQFTAGTDQPSARAAWCVQAAAFRCRAGVRNGRGRGVLGRARRPPFRVLALAWTVHGGIPALDRCGPRLAMSHPASVTGTDVGAMTRGCVLQDPWPFGRAGGV